MTSGDVSDFMSGPKPDRFKVIVPLDGSQNSERALAYLPAISPVGAVEVWLVGIVEESEFHDSERLEREHSLLAAYLKEKAASLHEGLSRCETSIVRGQAKTAIVEEAERLDADLVLISSHGRSGIDRWRLGSVADKVVRSAGCDVLVLGKDANVVNPQIKKILVPLDGSELSEQALPLAQRFVSNLGAELHLLQIISTTTLAAPDTAGLGYASPGIYDAVIEGAEAYMTQKKEETGAVHSAAILGLPAEGLLTYAEENGIDLIIMTSHGRGGVMRTALGSVTDRLLGGRTPVLVVKGR